ncbi:MAG: ribosome maturation factor RimM, partial [Alphaproteobacteria bacterium]
MPRKRPSRRPATETRRRRSPPAAAGWVCVGTIGRPKGVRGAVRITTYTERPKDIAAYGPVFDAPNGRALEITLSGSVKGGVVASISGVGDREAAAALTGTPLYVPRAALPEAGEDEYYRADLIGLGVERTDGSAFGTVAAVDNYGAGDILEIAPAGGGE